MEHPHILLLDLFFCHSFSDNLFIGNEMDEPTNPLDMASVDALALAMKNFECSVVIVSHGFGLLNEVAEEIWEVADKAVRNPTKEDISIIDRKRNLMKHSGARLENVKLISKIATKGKIASAK
ncbi:hypothetical protein F4604DRAFT_1936224 [Suillus subluteus]|nr:hypothetical protein F4604DRAFT_1936224 [Suillus subluteus]